MGSMIFESNNLPGFLEEREEVLQKYPVTLKDIEEKSGKSMRTIYRRLSKGQIPRSELTYYKNSYRVTLKGANDFLIYKLGVKGEE